MHNFSRAEAAVRHLPTSPAFFGIFVFAVLAFALYIALRQDQD